MQWAVWNNTYKIRRKRAGYKFSQEIIKGTKDMQWAVWKNTHKMKRKRAGYKFSQEMCM